ncbi:hypothetical protein FB451DRAFT_1195096 [Mycena latifolia]|nr:hypothetical protein FB451DRAFT_1195096 [Mycena latifolia]
MAELSPSPADPPSNADLQLHAQQERDKAKLRMRRWVGMTLRESRKQALAPGDIGKLRPDVAGEDVEKNEEGETYVEFLERARWELRASPEFHDFCEYCDTVRVVRICYDKNDPQAVAEVDDFYRAHPYPCVADTEPYNDDYVEWLFHNRNSMTPEWKEELLDFKDFLAEHTPEELDRRQRMVCEALGTRLVILGELRYSEACETQMCTSQIQLRDLATAPSETGIAKVITPGMAGAPVACTCPAAPANAGAPRGSVRAGAPTSPTAPPAGVCAGHPNSPTGPAPGVRARDATIIRVRDAGIACARAGTPGSEKLGLLLTDVVSLDEPRRQQQLSLLSRPRQRQFLELHEVGHDGGRRRASMLEEAQISHGIPPTTWEKTNPAGLEGAAVRLVARVTGDIGIPRRDFGEGPREFGELVTSAEDAVHEAGVGSEDGCHADGVPGGGERQSEGLSVRDAPTNMTPEEMIPDTINPDHDPRYWCLPPMHDDPSEDGALGHKVGIWRNWTAVEALVTRYPSGAQWGHHTVEGCIKEWQVLCCLGVHPHPADPRLGGQVRDVHATVGPGVVNTAAPPITPAEAVAATESPSRERGRVVEPGLQAALQRYCMPNLPARSLGGGSTRTETSTSVSSSSSLTACSWSDVPVHAHYYAIWESGIVYAARKDVKAAFKWGEAHGEKPQILTTEDFDEAQAFAEGVHWISD